MSTDTPPLASPAPAVKLTQALILLFAFSCGAIVSNLYYAQPITELIAPGLHMSSGTASLIVSLTQIGYAFGLFFIVPLGDLLENRKLMIVTAVVSIASLAAAAVVRTPGLFLAVSLLIGFSSVAVQILVPLAAHLAPDHSRGRVVGTIMSGLLLGILLARPLSSVVADAFGWRVVFAGAAVVMTLVTAVLALTIPSRQPDHRATYFALIGSLLHLVRTMPVLRHRAFYQGLMFASTVRTRNLVRFLAVTLVGFVETMLLARGAEALDLSRGMSIVTIALLIPPTTFVLHRLWTYR